MLARFYTAPLVLEFAFGMLVARAIRRLGERPLGVRLALSMVAGGTAAILLFAFVEGGPPLRLLTIGVPAALIVYGMAALDAGARSVRSATAMLLGAASYSIYLIHAFVLGVVERIAARFGLDDGAMLPVTMIVAVFAALAAGVILHLLVERPLDLVLRRALGRSAGGTGQGDAVALWPWWRRPPSRG